MIQFEPKLKEWRERKGYTQYHNLQDQSGNFIFEVTTKLRRVEETENFPLRCIGVFYSENVCTQIVGVVVGPAHILTAYQPLRNYNVGNLYFHCKRTKQGNGLSEGKFNVKAKVSRIYHNKLYENDTSQAYDYAVVIVQKPFPVDIGYLGMVSDQESTSIFQEFESFNNGCLVIVGYHQETYWYSNCGLGDILDDQILVSNSQTCESFWGGCPGIYRDPDFGYCVVGIFRHQTQSGRLEGFYLNPKIQNHLYDWMRGEDQIPRQQLQFPPNLIYGQNFRKIQSIPILQQYSSSQKIVRVNNRLAALIFQTEKMIIIYNYRNFKVQKQVNLDSVCQDIQAHQNLIYFCKDSEAGVLDWNSDRLLTYTWKYPIYAVQMLQDELFCAGDFKGNIIFLEHSTLEGTIRLSGQIRSFEQGNQDGHSKFIQCLCKLTNSLMASGSGDGTIKLWDWRNKKLMRVIEGHQKGKSIYSLIYEKSKQHLISCSSDQTVRIWDLQKNLSANKIQLKGKVLQVCLLNNEEILAIDGNELVLGSLANSYQLDKISMKYALRSLCQLDHSSFLVGDEIGQIFFYYHPNSNLNPEQIISQVSQQPITGATNLMNISFDDKFNLLKTTESDLRGEISNTESSMPAEKAQRANSTQQQLSLSLAQLNSLLQDDPVKNLKRSTNNMGTQSSEFTANNPQKSNNRFGESEYQILGTLKSADFGSLMGWQANNSELEQGTSAKDTQIQDLRQQIEDLKDQITQKDAELQLRRHDNQEYIYVKELQKIRARLEEKENILRVQEKKISKKYEQEIDEVEKRYRSQIQAIQEQHRAQIQQMADESRQNLKNSEAQYEGLIQRLKRDFQEERDKQSQLHLQDLQKLKRLTEIEQEKLREIHSLELEQVKKNSVQQVQQKQSEIDELISRLERFQNKLEHNEGISSQFVQNSEQKISYLQGLTNELEKEKKQFSNTEKALKLEIQQLKIKNQILKSKFRYEKQKQEETIDELDKEQSETIVQLQEQLRLQEQEKSSLQKQITALKYQVQFLEEGQKKMETDLIQKDKRLEDLQNENKINSFRQSIETNQSLNYYSYQNQKRFLSSAGEGNILPRGNINANAIVNSREKGGSNHYNFSSVNQQIPPFDNLNMQNRNSSLSQDSHEDETMLKQRAQNSSKQLKKKFKSQVESNQENSDYANRDPSREKLAELIDKILLNQESHDLRQKKKHRISTSVESDRKKNSSSRQKERVATQKMETQQSNKKLLQDSGNKSLGQIFEEYLGGYLEQKKIKPSQQNKSDYSKRFTSISPIPTRQSRLKNENSINPQYSTIDNDSEEKKYKKYQSSVERYQKSPLIKNRQSFKK